MCPAYHWRCPQGIPTATVAFDSQEIKNDRRPAQVLALLPFP
jgi:hypothetical protein